MVSRRAPKQAGSCWIRSRPTCRGVPGSSCSPTRMGSRFLSPRRARTIMRAFPLVGCIVFAAASSLAAQVPSAEVQIAGAVSAAPENMRNDATVIGYSNYHRMTVLRQGTGEMICLADDPSAASWHVACYHKDLEPFMAMGRDLEALGKTSQ